MNRRKLKKEERLAIHKMLDGRCAYCGKEIKYEDMQVDHIVPLNGYNVQGEDTLENMFPSCRSCNHYKRGNTLEGFRKMIEEIPKKLERDSYIYRVGVRYHNVEARPKKIKFYFELKRSLPTAPAASSAGAMATAPCIKVESGVKKKSLFEEEMNKAIYGNIFKPAGR